MITSTKNDQVKAVIELKKKARARNEQGLFVVEGVRMAAELPKDQVKSIYVSETFAKNPENAAILAEYPGYELVSDSVFAVMSDTQTPQGVLALVRQFSYGMDELLKSDRPAHHEGRKSACRRNNYKRCKKCGSGNFSGGDHDR